MEKRVEKAIDTYKKFPRATTEYKLVSIFLDRFTWDDGLTKEELAKIVYGSQLRSKELHMSQAKIRISGIISKMSCTITNKILLFTLFDF